MIRFFIEVLELVRIKEIRLWFRFLDRDEFRLDFIFWDLERRFRNFERFRLRGFRFFDFIFLANLIFFLDFVDIFNKLY